MAVSPASVAVGKCYVRFTEVRRVTEVASDGDVKYISRMKTESGLGWSNSTGRTTKEQFALEVEREVPSDYDPYASY